MRYLKKYFLILVLFFIAIALLYAWRVPCRQRPKTPPLKHKPAKLPTTREYKYIPGHDYDKDGIVDTRDRLIWINIHKSSFTAMKINEYNADIFEVMDFDNDGKATKKEMDRYIAVYDLNKNGFLEENEIGAAAK